MLCATQFKLSRERRKRACLRRVRRAACMRATPSRPSQMARTTDQTERKRKLGALLLGQDAATH